MKVQRTDDGRLMWWCAGCDEPHAIDGTWSFNGDVDKPTFQPSVLVTGYSRHSVERRCHTFVTDGRIQYLNDCSHSLAGQTLDMPEWPYCD